MIHLKFSRINLTKKFGKVKFPLFMNTVHVQKFREINRHLQIYSCYHEKIRNMEINDLTIFFSFFLSIFCEDEIFVFKIRNRDIKMQWILIKSCKLTSRKNVNFANCDPIFIWFHRIFVNQSDGSAFKSLIRGRITYNHIKYILRGFAIPVSWE